MPIPIPHALGRYLAPAIDLPNALDFTGGTVRLDRHWLALRRAQHPDLGVNQLVREADWFQRDFVHDTPTSWRPWRPDFRGDDPPIAYTRSLRTWIADGPEWQQLLQQVAEHSTQPSAGRLLTPADAETHLGLSRRKLTELLKQTTGTEPGAPDNLASATSDRKRWRWRTTEDIDTWYAAMMARRTRQAPRPAAATGDPRRVSSHTKTRKGSTQRQRIARPSDGRKRNARGEVDLIAEAMREG